MLYIVDQLNGFHISGTLLDRGHCHPIRYGTETPEVVLLVSRSQMKKMHPETDLTLVANGSGVNSEVNYREYTLNGF